MKHVARLTVVLGVGLLVLTSAAAPPPAASAEAGIPFALGSIDGLQPGDCSYYAMKVSSDWGNVSGIPMTLGPTTYYARVVVTNVLKAKDAVRVKARIDCTDKDGNSAQHGREVYRALLARGGSLRRVHVEMNMAVDYGEGPTTFSGDPAGLDGGRGVPCFLLGYPPIPDVPKDGQASPKVDVERFGAVAVRYAPSYDGLDRLVKVKVDYFRQAREDDRKKGKQILYLDPHPRYVLDSILRQRGPGPVAIGTRRDLESAEYKVLTAVPMGVEAAPFLDPNGDYPKNEPPAFKYRVLPVSAWQSEEQEWDPGAAFPKHVVRKDEMGHVLFDLTLLRTGKVALDVEGSAPEGEAPTSSSEATPAPAN